MTIDRTTRLSGIGAVLPERAPSVLAAAITMQRPSRGAPGHRPRRGRVPSPRCHQARAVGIVLWELLAHRRLRVGAKGDIEAKAVFQAIPRPCRYRQGVPADLENVAMRLLAYDRAERYRTAELAAHDLMRCQDVSRLAYDRAERYRTAELAAHDLMRCQDVSRDGRGDLVRLLDERFPRSRRRRPTSHPPAPSTPSEVRTVAALSEPVGAPP